MHFRSTIRIVSSAVLIALAAACSKDSEGSAQAAPARGPGGGGAGGRPAPSITLTSTDVAQVTRASIEEGTPITGDLRPIETIDVRARLEGDVVGVYVREGDRVGQGQLLARFEASEQESGRRSAEADRVSAQTDLSTAQWNLEQTQELFKAGAVPERDLKTAQQAVVAARARLAAAESRLRSTSSSLSDTRVLAPATGVIEKRLVENGEHVARGAPLFTLVRNEVLELAASVPARQASDVHAGQPVHFSADGRSVDGRVARVSPTIDPATRSITVYAQVPNAGGVFKGGTFASGRIVSRTLEGVVVVPTAALRQSQEGGHPYVYRVRGGVVDQADVSVGVTDESRGLTQVLAGLQVGDVVIVGNVGTLGRGMKVNVINPDQQGSRATR